MPLGARDDLGDARFVGCELDADARERASPRDVLERATRGGFDFIIHPAAVVDDVDDDSTTPWAHSDEELTSTEWSTRVVLRTSRGVERESLRGAEARKKLERELRWAGHVGAHAVCARLTPDDDGDVSRLAQSVMANVDALTHTKVWLRTNVTGDSKIDDDAYRAWAETSAACEHRANVYVALHVTGAPKSRAELMRWMGERVGVVFLSVDAFVKNSRGFPVLPRELQAFARETFSRGTQVVLTDRRDDDDGVDVSSSSTMIRPGDVPGDEGRVDAESAHPMRLYWEYLVYLFRGVEPLSEQALAEIPYRDALQAPLQPLMDNLESVTYETFEKDASKYIQYEEAVRCALTDLVREGEEGTVMVVGAGRGPLIRASLRAATRANRKIAVYAVEKNPNAVITLQHFVARENLQDVVQIYPGDMRTCALDIEVDVLVSELLGSFGDNELSPECLDGAQRFIRPGGVSVPQSYESFVAPVTAAKLYDAAAANGDVKSLETPYVVKFSKVHHIAEPKSVWEFVHPNHDDVIDNERYARCAWSREEIGSTSVTLHGFSAYFDALLYDGPAGCVRCSIHPGNHTIGPTGLMFSWFPMYFPIRSPILLDGRDDADAAITLHVWRRVDAHKMWYEWSVSKPTQGHVHNANGRSYWIGL